jgi:hypothetical protein
LSRIVENQLGNLIPKGSKSFNMSISRWLAPRFREVGDERELAARSETIAGYGFEVGVKPLGRRGIRLDCHSSRST